MGRRHEISDADFERIRPLLTGLPGQHGGIADDNRRFINAVLHVAKTGIPWRDLPERYGKQAFVEAIESRGAEAVIPTRSNSPQPRTIDPHHYRERNVCERFWAQAKQFRRVATRYEKKAANFLAFAWIASIMVMLK